MRLINLPSRDTHDMDHNVDNIRYKHGQQSVNIGLQRGAKLRVLYR